MTHTSKPPPAGPNGGAETIGGRPISAEYSSFPRQRQRLPHRRPNAIIEIAWQGQRIAACIGYDATGRPAEIFARLTKPGSELDLMLDDLGVLLSLLLQHGVAPAQLAHSVGCMHGKPASVVGVLVDLLANEQ